MKKVSPVLTGLSFYVQLLQKISIFCETAVFNSAPSKAFISDPVTNSQREITPTGAESYFTRTIFFISL
jgi:hypothetical protein